MIGKNAKTGDIYYQDKTKLNFSTPSKLEIPDITTWASLAQPFTLFCRMTNRWNAWVTPLFDIQRLDSPMFNRILMSLRPDDTFWLVLRGTSGTFGWRSLPFTTVQEMTVQFTFNGSQNQAGGNLYVNGSPIAKDVTFGSTTGAFSTASPQQFKIGQTYYDGDNDTNAEFYNISISDTVRTAGERATDLANGYQGGNKLFEIDFEKLHQDATPHAIQNGQYFESKGKRVELNNNQKYIPKF